MKYENFLFNFFKLETPTYWIIIFILKQGCLESTADSVLMPCLRCWENDHCWKCMLPWLIAHGFLEQNPNHTPLPKGKPAATFIMRLN